MGWSYSHVALFGPAQEDVSQTLAGRHAVISPTIGGVTLVASEEFASHDPQQIANFSIMLATTLNCAALVISEYDDDVLSYRLIESGKITDEYNSGPDYFDFAGKHVPPRGPQGGDAIRLCQALGRPEVAKEVGSALRKDDMGLSAPNRHAELAAILGMPAFSVGFDYEAVHDRELPEGLNEEDIIFTGEQE
jgi:hypothetical protein